LSGVHQEVVNDVNDRFCPRPENPEFAAFGPFSNIQATPKQSLTVVEADIHRMRLHREDFATS
jgi:hypothetical protein